VKKQLSIRCLKSNQSLDFFFPDIPSGASIARGRPAPKWHRRLAPSLRSRWDNIGQKPGGSAAPTYLFFAKRKGKPKETKKYIPISFKKEVTYWAEHKQKRLRFG